MAYNASAIIAILNISFIHSKASVVILLKSSLFIVLYSPLISDTWSETEYKVIPQ